MMVRKKTHPTRINMSSQCPTCLSENAPQTLNCVVCGTPLVTAQVTYHLSPGTILVNQQKQYRLDKTIGAGGFGIAYKGVDLQTNQAVAIKENWPENGIRQGNNIIWPLKITPQEKNEQIAQVIKEAQSIQQYSHPNIVKIYDSFQANNTAYIVMEFLDGKSLYDYFKEQGKLTESVVKKYFLQVAEALKFIHSKKLLHRDIKPDNIIVTSQDKAVLIDFGNAREYIANKTQKMTQTLTAGYAPLEQYSNTGRRSPALDIYACCASMYELLTGQLPPDATERMQKECLIPPRKIIPSLDPYLEQVILTGLQINVEDRLQNADSLISALQGKLITPSLDKARQLVKQNQLQEAVKAYDKCLQEQPWDGDVALELAMVLIHLNQDTTAALAANQAIKLLPQDGRGYGVLGLVFCREGKPKEAIAPLQTAAKLSPYQSWIQANLAWALGKLERWQEAEIAASEAIKLDNQSDVALGLQAWISVNQKQYKNAIRYARQSLFISKQKSKISQIQKWVYPCLTVALDKAVITQQAPDLERCLQEYISQVPGDSFPWGFKAYKQARLGLGHEAKSSLAQIKGNVPPWILLNQGIIQEQLGLLNEAQHIYQTYEQKYPPSPFVLFRLGSISGHLNQWQKAKTYLEKAIKLKPDYAEAYHNLGWVLLHLKKPNAELEDPRGLLAAYRQAIQHYSQQQKFDLAEAIKNAFAVIQVEI